MKNTKRTAARAGSTRIPTFIWVLAVALVAAILWRTTAGRNPLSHHPEPRADASAQFVVNAERYASAPDVARVYEMAKEIPHVIDGLFCHCDCARNFNHRSLLTCFESDHGAACDVCMREVVVAYQLTQQGQTLDQIRSQIDAMMGG
jgi:hypothetical protein